MKRFSVSPFAAALWIGLSTGSVAEERVTWSQIDLPPVTITSGDFAGQGYADLTSQYFIERMPEFQHEPLEMPVKRMLTMLKTKDGICDPAIFKTPEREQMMYFSSQVYWVQANRIIFSIDNEAKFQKHLKDQSVVDLESLMSDETLIGGVVRGRSYSAVIDSALDTIRGRPNLFDLTESAQGFGMLEAGRLDWIVGYSFEASYFFRKENFSEHFISYAAKGDTAILPGYIACSKGPLGKKVITRINEIIEEANSRPPYLRYYLNWLDLQATAEIHNEFSVPTRRD